MRQILLAALAVGAGLFCCCACSAPSTVSITLDDIEQEQLLLSDLQPNTPTPGPDDGVAPLTIIRAVESCGDGYIVYPKVLYCAHGEEINRSICELTAQRAASVSTAIFTQYRIEYNRNGLIFWTQRIPVGEESCRISLWPRRKPGALLCSAT